MTSKTTIHLYVRVSRHLGDILVWVCEALPRTSYLVKEQFSPLLPPQVHHLHRHLPAAVLLRCNTNHPRGSLTDLHKVVQVGSRISLADNHLQSCLKLFVGHLGWVWWRPRRGMLRWPKGRRTHARRTGGQWTCRWWAGLGGAVFSRIGRVGAARVSEKGFRPSGPHAHVRRQSQRVARRRTHCPLGSDAPHERTTGASGQEAGMVPYSRFSLKLRDNRVTNTQKRRLAVFLVVKMNEINLLAKTGFTSVDLTDRDAETHW